MDAIVLKSTPYEEDGKILKVFSSELGLISIVTKGLQRRPQFWQTATSPLSRSEFHITRRGSDLFFLQEASLIDAHVGVRGRLDTLESALSILKSLLDSQYPERPSKELYALTLLYLKKLPTFPNPITLSLSFKMKLLNLEGLFTDTYEAQFSKEMWLILECLCHAKQFSLLEDLSIAKPLQKEIEELFAMRIAEGGT